MKSNLLLNRIHEIQSEYKELLTVLLPKLKNYHASEALDEISIFWLRHIDEVQLYLRTFFSGEDSFVFTAASYMDFEYKEHLPFLLIGDKRVLDDPLSKYSEICNNMPEDKSTEFLYEQICIAAEENIKILENLHEEIIILPLRLLNQSDSHDMLFDIGEQAFVSLFSDIDSIDDYFSKCGSIEEIIRHMREDSGRLVRFSEEDDTLLPFNERFKIALTEAECMLDANKPDSYNFFMLVFGYIQQAIDVIASCVEYRCIPYIRHTVELNYVSILSECMLSIEHIQMLRFKMSVAFIIYRTCDKEKLSSICLEKFLEKNKEYNFYKNLIYRLEEQEIDEKNYLRHSVSQLINDELEKFYIALSDESCANEVEDEKGN